MNAGDGRKALQFFQGKLQRPVHHAVKQKAILPRIDVRNNSTTVGAHKVERRWCDNPHLVLKRSQYVKRQAELVGRWPFENGYAHRCHVMRAFAIGDLILQGTLYRGRCWCLSACGLNRTHGRRRGATLQKFSTTGFFRVHGSLLGSCIPLPVPIIYW